MDIRSTLAATRAVLTETRLGPTSDLAARTAASAPDHPGISLHQPVAADALMRADAARWFAGNAREASEPSALLDAARGAAVNITRLRNDLAAYSAPSQADEIAGHIDRLDATVGRIAAGSELVRFEGIAARGALDHALGAGLDDVGTLRELVRVNGPSRTEAATVAAAALRASAAG